MSFTSNNREPSLGDIFRHLLDDNDSRQAALDMHIDKRQHIPTHFKTARVIDVNSAAKIQRIKNYRNVHHTTLLEAKRAVECMMLIEMVGEAENMEDVKLVYEYAMRTIYPSLSS